MVSCDSKAITKIGSGGHTLGTKCLQLQDEPVSRTDHDAGHEDAKIRLHSEQSLSCQDDQGTYDVTVPDDLVVNSLIPSWSRAVDMVVRPGYTLSLGHVQEWERT